MQDVEYKLYSMLASLLNRKSVSTEEIKSAGYEIDGARQMSFFEMEG